MYYFPLLFKTGLRQMKEIGNRNKLPFAYFLCLLHSKACHIRFVDKANVMGSDVCLQISFLINFICTCYKSEQIIKSQKSTNSTET